jgi:hypothetical protein
MYAGTVPMLSYVNVIRKGGYAVSIISYVLSSGDIYDVVKPIIQGIDLEP